MPGTTLLSMKCPFIDRNQRIAYSLLKKESIMPTGKGSYSKPGRPSKARKKAAKKKK